VNEGKRIARDRCASYLSASYGVWCLSRSRSLQPRLLWGMHKREAVLLRRRTITTLAVLRTRATAASHLRAVRRFSAVFRWNPDILLCLIYRSDEASVTRILKSGIRKNVPGLRFAASGLLARWSRKRPANAVT